MTTLTSTPPARLIDDQPAIIHPPFCAMDHGDNTSHVGAAVFAETICVVVVQGTKGPVVWIGTRPYLPEDARAFAGLLSVLGHAVLAAAITNAVRMAES